MTSPAVLEVQQHRGPRDPSGLNSMGVSTRKEPVGAMPAERSPLGGQGEGTVLPPTPTRRSHPATAPLMAMLVGAPPPPPDTPPPRKRRSGSARRRREALQAENPGTEQVPVSISATESKERESLGMTSPRSRIEAEEEDRRIAGIMEERLRAARAIYQSDSLVMDPPTGEHLTGRPSKNPTPKAEQQENTLPTSGGGPRKTVGDLLTSAINTSVPPPPSPTSTSTEQMGNHLTVPAAQGPLSPLENSDNLVGIEGGSGFLAAANTPKAGSAKKRPKTPQRIRRALTPKRSKTPDRRKEMTDSFRRSSSEVVSLPSKSPNLGRRHSVGEEHETKSTAKKGGLFRKIFGGKRKSKRATGETETKNSGDAESITVATDGKSMVTAPKHNKSTPTREQDEMAHQEIGPKPIHGVSFANSDEGKIGAAHLDENRPDSFFGNDEVSTLTAPTYESHRRTDPADSSEMNNTADPMGHYFPHATFSSSKSGDDSAETLPMTLTGTMPSFDPFTGSFYESQRTQATVPQTLPEPIMNQRGGLSIAIDTAFEPAGESPHHERKVRMLAEENAIRHSIKDPSPRGQSTMLYAIQDPSPRGFEQMPDPSPRIQPQKPAPLTIQDPSPRGYQTPQFAEHPTQDPFGESPLHKNQRGPSALRDGSPYAPDPPLHLSNLDMSVGSSGSSASESGEEKKEEFVSLAEDNLAFKRLTPPPPPPPPRAPPSPANRARSPSMRAQELLRASSNRSRSPSVSDKNSSSTVEDVPPGVETIASAAAIPRFLTRQRRAPNVQSSARKLSGDSDVSDGHVEKQSTPEYGEPIDSDLILEEQSRAGMELDLVEQEDDESALTDASTIKTTASSKRATKKLLTMSAAARMNAKAMSYLHTLNGDPSPRKAWTDGVVSDDDASPANQMLEKRRGVMDPCFSSPADKPIPAGLTHGDNEEGEDDASHLFAAHKSKFKGRKSANSGAAAKATEFRKRVRCRGTPSPSAKDSKKMPKKMMRNVSISGDVFTMGVGILREKRELGIQSGRLLRCTPHKTIAAPKSESYSVSKEVPEPMDPIQRAGRRLLSKAAVPIQAGARRFLAQREAVDRMWALIEIQSYFRRWKCQASFLAYRTSANLIQRSFRGMRSRSELRVQKEAATNIQRIMRGYIASIRTFDTVFMIILVQARARGNLVRDNVLRLKEETRHEAAKSVQTWWRCHSAQKSYSALLTKLLSAQRIQTWWRCSTARANYQFLVVDVIISQSVVRRWRAEKNYHAILHERRNAAAIKIQSAWRGFQGYTDYIFSLVDVIVVQRTARQWLAKKKVNAIRRERAATVVQSHFRRYSAQMRLLFSLVNIILVQSAARRFLAKNALARKRGALVEENRAATKIQAAWRGFWKFSHLVIMQYEATRIQAAVRGMQVRREATVRLGSCIMIQTAARRFLAIRTVRDIKVSRLVVAAAAEALREKHASMRIQFWWRVVLDCRKEKAAALVIERFFLMVKREVDREIARVAKKSKSKRSSRRRRKKESDEKVLERVWLNTVDEVQSDAFYSPSESGLTPMSRVSMLSQSPTGRLSTSRSRGLKDKKSSSRLSPSTNLKTKSSFESRASAGRDPRSDGLSFTYSADGSEITTSTASFAAMYRSNVARKSAMSRSEMADDLSLEEAFLDTAVQQGKERKRSAEKYMKMYGIRSTRSEKPVHRSNHFFADDLESTLTGMSSGSSSIKGIKFASSQSPSSGTPTNGMLRSPHGSTRSSPAARNYPRIPSPTKRQQPSPRMLSTSPRGSPKANPYPEYLSKQESKRVVEPEQVTEDEYGLI